MTFKEKCTAIIALAVSRLKKNNYTQASPKREQVENGWSDCSSLWWYIFKKVLGIFIGGNTAAQIVSDKGVDVDIADGPYPDESKLQFGDLLYFKGTDKRRPFMVGHVEGYSGPNECIGHGSGVGPTRKNLRDYCKKRYNQGKGYIKARRFIPGTSDTSQPNPSTPADDLGFGHRTLKLNMSGSDVKAVQMVLIMLGYSCGKWGADGQYGTATRNAVKAFQQDMKLAVDGIAGPKTFAALKSAMPQGDPDDDDATPESYKSYVVVTSKSVHVRTEPTARGAHMAYAYEGDRLPYRGETVNGWYAVLLDGEDGWITGKFTRVE